MSDMVCWYVIEPRAPDGVWTLVRAGYTGGNLRVVLVSLTSLRPVAPPQQALTRTLEDIDSTVLHAAHTRGRDCEHNSFTIDNVLSADRIDPACRLPIGSE